MDNTTTPTDNETLVRDKARRWYKAVFEPTANANNSPTVVVFPGKSVKRIHPRTQKQHTEMMERWRMEYIDQMVEKYTNRLFTFFVNEGLEVNTKKFKKDYTLVSEALKSALYREDGLPHGLHEFVDSNMDIISDDSEVIDKANTTIVPTNLIKLHDFNVEDDENEDDDTPPPNRVA